MSEGEVRKVEASAVAAARGQALLPSRLREGSGEGLFRRPSSFDTPSPNPSHKREGN